MGTTLTALVVLRADERTSPASRSSTSATRAPTCCATACCTGPPSTTATCRSWSPPATSPRTRRARHPRRNIVTRALGIEPTVRVDTWMLPMVHGDRFILCSDGLVDEVARRRHRHHRPGGRRPPGRRRRSWSPWPTPTVGATTSPSSWSTCSRVSSRPRPTPSSNPSRVGRAPTRRATMIDADADSVAQHGRRSSTTPARRYHRSSTSPGSTIPHRPAAGERVAFLKLLGAAALIITVVVTLIAVAVHNSNDNGVTPRRPPARHRT